MRVLVCGGRSYTNWLKVYTTLDALLEEHGHLTVIHGGSSGADTLASQWCAKRSYRHPKKITEIREPADWVKHGKAAGPIRNARMLAEHAPELVVAFPGDRGTADMVRKALEAGVEVREIEG